MALSVAIFVGETKDWVKDFTDKAKTLKIGSGFDSATSLGPVISPESKKRIEAMIARAESEGATIALDGRNTTVPGFEKVTNQCVFHCVF